MMMWLPKRKHKLRFDSLEAAPAVLSLWDVANLVDRSPRTVQRWVKSGKLPVAQTSWADPNTGIRWLMGRKPAWLKSDLMKLGLIR
jgi:hypothetical protein